MNPGRKLSSAIGWALVLNAVLLLAACSNPFVVRHKVLVDAIAAPGLQKQTGQSYRLLAKKSVISQVQAQVNVVKACVDAALANYGMYEPPPNVAPDIFIEVGYGVDTSPRVDPASRETFLQLSARANPNRAVDKGTGPEVWDVRVAVLGVAGRIESAMPLLCSVAANYMGTDTKIETKIEIPQNSPNILAVRENAIKALEKAAAPAGTAPAVSRPAAPTPQTPGSSPPPAPNGTGGTATGAAPGASK